MAIINLKADAYAKAKSVCKKLVFVGYLCLLAFFGYTTYQTHAEANAILKNHTAVDAELRLDDVTEERGRKGRVKNVYHFSYSFTANGQEYIGRFETSESNAEKYAGVDTVKVGYSNADPSHFDRLERLQDQADLGSRATNMLIIAALMALLAFVVYVVLTRRLLGLKPEAEAAAA